MQLEFKELKLLIDIVEFYQREQSFSPDGEHWNEVDCLCKKLVVAFID